MGTTSNCNLIFLIEKLNKKIIKLYFVKLINSLLYLATFQDLYNEIMPIYFPRNGREELYSVNNMPDDIGW